MTDADKTKSILEKVNQAMQHLHSNGDMTKGIRNSLIAIMTYIEFMCTPSQDTEQSE